MRSATLTCVGFIFASVCAIGLGAPVNPNAKPKRVVVGPNVILEIVGEKRRVIVASKVCLRMGALEGLLTRTKKKEHEYILAADIDARHLHTALTLAGAKAGSPVQFDPYRPASGTAIKVSLRYLKAGKEVSVPAQEWLRDPKAKKHLDKDWVFAGSKFLPNADPNKPPEYIANFGDLVCTCNMQSAVLDLPVRSPKNLEDRMYEAHTERIPEVDTKVDVVFEPVPVKKPGK
jgi:hypothetical protein